jgi:hypothetical protein
LAKLQGESEPAKVRTLPPVWPPKKARDDYPIKKIKKMLLKSDDLLKFKLQVFFIGRIILSFYYVLRELNILFHTLCRGM